MVGKATMVSFKNKYINRNTFEFSFRTFQKFSGLKETGKLDNKTWHLMLQPRCGFLDILPYTDRTLPVNLDNRKILFSVSISKTFVEF